LKLLVTLLLLASATPALQARDHGRDDERDRREHDSRDDDRGRDRDRDRDRGGQMSLDDAVQMVQQRYNAKVVRAESRHEDGRTVYYLRLLNSEGRVWTVRVDAQSGSIK
jgi:uncharacterized membrane protein YkoI